MRIERIHSLSCHWFDSSALCFEFPRDTWTKKKNLPSNSDGVCGLHKIAENRLNSIEFREKT